MTIVLIWRMNNNNTQKRKKLIDKKTARTRWPLESKKSWRDFSQNLLVPSFSSAYLLPSSTFSGSNIWVFDTWILSMMIDIASASSGLARAYSGRQSPLMGMEGRRNGGQRSSSNKVRMLDLFHFSLVRLGLHVWRSSSLLPCSKKLFLGRSYYLSIYLCVRLVGRWTISNAHLNEENKCKRITQHISIHFCR